MPASNQPDLGNLANCVQDACDALLDPAPGPPEPADYRDLVKRLADSRAKLPALYLDAGLEPFLADLRGLGEAKFNEVLAMDPDRESAARVLLDCAQAILQHGEDHNSPAREGFQEVVSDLYDGFLSAEDRRGVKPPDRSQTAPLVKWGDPDSVPYALESEATRIFGMKMGVISLPPSHAAVGLVGWAILGHETAGHEVLSADDGLRSELANKVEAALTGHGGVAQYWRRRIEETASDVMGVLNLGPAAGIGLIAYFRGLNAALGNAATLSNIGRSSEGHPPDIMRGYIAAETVRLLSFSGRHGWAQAIEDQTDIDAAAAGGTITMGDSTVDPVAAKSLARALAGVIATSSLDALERHSLIEIQDWADENQQVADGLRKSLAGGRTVEEAVVKGQYAAHVVAAAVYEALSAAGDLRRVFTRMTEILKAMHDANPSWGPILIEHPGALEVHYAVSAHRRAQLQRARRRRRRERQSRTK